MFIQYLAREQWESQLRIGDVVNVTDPRDNTCKIGIVRLMDEKLNVMLSIDGTGQTLEFAPEGYRVSRAYGSISDAKFKLADEGDDDG